MNRVIQLLLKIGFGLVGLCYVAILMLSIIIAPLTINLGPILFILSIISIITIDIVGFTLIHKLYHRLSKD